MIEEAKYYQKVIEFKRQKAIEQQKEYQEEHDEAINSYEWEEEYITNNKLPINIYKPNNYPLTMRQEIERLKLE